MAAGIPRFVTQTGTNLQVQVHVTLISCCYWMIQIGLGLLTMYASIQLKIHKLWVYIYTQKTHFHCLVWVKITIFISTLIEGMNKLKDVCYNNELCMHKVLNYVNWKDLARQCQIFKTLLRWWVKFPLPSTVDLVSLLPCPAVTL